MAPTLLVVNGRVWTGSAGAPAVEAVAVDDTRIAAVGRSSDLRALADRDTLIIDAGGRLVIPGITDSHAHFLWAGLQESRLDLRSVRGREEFIAQVAAQAEKLPPDRWLLGGRFAVEHWEKPEQPRKEWIDAQTASRPVFLTRADPSEDLVQIIGLMGLEELRQS